MTEKATLHTTALYALHQDLGARLVPFAGYSLPVQYPGGIIAEHLHTRRAASLFDVSHMGQITVTGPAAQQELESLMPVDLASLATGQACYALLTNDRGCVEDDLIVTRIADDSFWLVVNGACKVHDLALLERGCSTSTVTLNEQQALLALQGPEARRILAARVPAIATLPFMHSLEAPLAGASCRISCSGYTGEDGFEIALTAADAEPVARALLADNDVAMAGLGARDSLRLEAGLCLYGHELRADVTPLEAGLQWAIPRSRRAAGSRPGGYPGAAILDRQFADGVDRRRVGLLAMGKRPVREGQRIVSSDGLPLGEVTSGGFGPSVDAPIAMGFVSREVSAPGTELAVEVRGTTLAVTVAPLPFVPQRYYRGK